MADMEQAVGITAKLYRIRNVAKFLWGDEYPAKMRDWRAAIELVASRKKIGNLEAARAMGERALANGAESIYLTIMAAYVEMTEPSKEVTHG